MNIGAERVKRVHRPDSLRGMGWKAYLIKRGLDPNEFERMMAYNTPKTEMMRRLGIKSRDTLYKYIDQFEDEESEK